MPILPYCITLADAEVAAAATGVRGSSVETLAEYGLRCFYAVLADFSLASAADLKDEALRFDAVVREVLAQTAVIPFRFPTLLATLDELREFMEANAAPYSATLKRLAGLVQMELRIEHASLASTPSQSGTAYLEARGAAARLMSQQAEHARSIAGDLIRDWRTRNSPRGLRCYALIARDAIADFQARMRSLSAREGVTIVVSGPWPAAEFFHDPAQS